VSTNLIEKVLSCEIAKHLQNSLFDHKAISMVINKKPVFKGNKQKIQNKVLNSDILDLLDYSAAADTYLQHRVNKWDPLLENKLRLVGKIKGAILEVGLCWKDKPGTDPDPEKIRQRERTVDHARYLLQTLNFDLIEQIEVNVGKDLFMDVLVNNIRNDACSYQSFFIREKNSEFNLAVKKLANLKTNFSENFEQILVLEKKLNMIKDAEMRAELENYAILEYVSAEKMTPKFLDLAKKGKSESKLTDIKKPDGEPFESESSQKDFILGYFSNIYKKNPEVRAYEGCIEDFLGPDICNHPTVRGQRFRKT
jgi:hypothetical protein